MLTPEFRILAVRALDRVLAGDSELNALWGSEADSDEWRAGIAALRRPLAGVT